MGCVASRVDQEERVRLCKERKRLMRELVRYREDFANSQLAYLRALKNTGVTLRQFTESDSLELESISYEQTLTSSPPSPLPPPPPPPPPFSPDSRKAGDKGSSPAYWDVSEDTSALGNPKHSETIDHYEDYNYTESEMEKSQSGEVFDDNSSMMSWFNKDSSDAAMEALKNRKTLEGIIRELDDYFLKASAGATGIAVFTDINIGENSVPWKIKEGKGRRSPSSKGFSALSWSWSSKSLPFARDAVQCGSSEPCKPGAHCITLNKLYVAEQNLYKQLEEEESNQVELEKKLMVLQNEDESSEWTKTEKIRSSIETLDTENRSLQESITTTSSSILELIDEELYPQLIALTSGLMEIWKVMYKSHETQNHISLQLKHLTESLNLDKITESHCQATAQLETEVSFWYQSFSKLIVSQREYVRTLCGWIQLTDCLAGSQQQQSHCSSAIRKLCEKWLIGFEKLPDKVAGEAIKSFLLAIQLIIQQQAEEQNQQKRCDKLEKRLQKELNSLTEMEDRFEGSSATSALSPKHPLSLKRAKVEALKKQVSLENAKQLNSLQAYKGMILNHMKTRLPSVFHALMVFSKASTQVFESILSPGTSEIY